MRELSNADVLGKLIDILDHRFGGAWHHKEFQSVGYDPCDSLNSIDEIAELLRQYDHI